MRIHLNLTPTQLAVRGKGCEEGGAAASQQQAPQPLLAMSPNGELVLIELQGSLEMDAQTDEEGGQTVIGELHWGQGSQDKPTLVLSHHRLEGKLTKLSKPMAVLEKKQRAPALADGSKEESQAVPATPPHDDPPSSPVYTTGVAPGIAQLFEDSSGDEAEGHSTPLSRKRRPAGGEPQSPSARHVSGKHTPGSLPRPQKRQALDRQDTMPRDRIPSSSPPPPPPVLGSAVDYSSPPATPSKTASARAEADAGDTTPRAKLGQPVPLGERAQVTSTYYDVVCVIRQKILFSKRPEPVVHLQTSQHKGG
ncbi:unnamed protein product [Parajaminaea phylloscopi]